MSNENNLTIPLFGDKDFYLALATAERFGFKQSYHVIDKKFWGSIQDWLAGMLGSKKAGDVALDHFMRSDTWISVCALKADTELRRNLPYIATDGKTYDTAHGSEFLLYTIANWLRATKGRPQIGAVKAFLAQSGVIVGETIRDPEGTAAKLLNLPDNATTRKELKALRKATDNGYSYTDAKERTTMRETLRDVNIRVSAIRKGYGVVTVDHHRRLNAIDFRNGVLFESEDWKRQHGINKDALEHLSTLDLVSLIYAKETAMAKYAQRQPKTYSELVEIGEEIKEECERNRSILSRILPARFLKPPDPKPEQKLLNAGDTE